jgi:hypothetical protein
VASVAAARAQIAELSERATVDRRRAARAAAIAAEHEAHRDLPPASLRPLRIRMAALHRRLEARHLESARMQELYAWRLGHWSFRRDPTAARPTFVDAIASAIGRRSASVTLLGRDGVESLVAASDVTARLAHDVEFVMGEGPVRDVAATMRPVRVDGAALKQRWPRYGPVVIEYGVGSVISLPLRQVPGGCLGALSVYDPTPAGAADVHTASIRVADALVHTVLNVPGAIADDEVPAVSMFDEADFLATVHQAAGIVSATLDCKLSDAMALLRARSFADGMPVETLARRVIQGDVHI